MRLRIGRTIAMRRFTLSIFLAATFLAATHSPALHAETGSQAWLGYTRLHQRAAQNYTTLPDTVFTLGDTAIIRSAQQELIRGIGGILERTLRVAPNLPTNPAIVLGTLQVIQKIVPTLRPPADLHDDGYWLTQAQLHGDACIIITATNDRGVLYGVFALLRKIAQNESITDLHDRQLPYAPIRWIDQWDNLDGSIERGYAG